MPAGQLRISSTSLITIFVSIVATVFIGERLLQLTREIAILRSQLNEIVYQKTRLQWALREADIKDLSELRKLSNKEPCVPSPQAKVDVLGVPLDSIWTANTGDLPFDGPAIDSESVHTVGTEEDDPNMPPILGQVDLIEDGFVSGWACEKGNQKSSHEVKVYLNDVLAAVYHTKGAATHPLVERICAGPADIGSDDVQIKNVAFKIQLSPLRDGIYTLRAFVYSRDGTWRKELNSSPQKFIESSLKPELSDAVKRKDAIIRARNAQVASLYERLNGNGIWSKVLSFEQTEHLARNKEGKKYLAFVGLISNPEDIRSRDVQRKTWFPQREELDRIAEEKGVILRLVVDKSDEIEEEQSSALLQEIKEHDDIVVLDVKGSQDKARKALSLFSTVSQQYDVDFVFKGDQDTVVDVDALVAFLEPRRNKGGLYIGCMKTGEVIKDAKEKWYEAEYWKFGDPQGISKLSNYPRHAQRQLMGVSQMVATYLAQNAGVMHFYANDDVSVGVWLLGLKVEFVHDRKFCCSPVNCRADGTLPADRCIGYAEPTCNGVCNPDTAIPRLYKNCMSKL